jgi:hypothetical protein
VVAARFTVRSSILESFFGTNDVFFNVADTVGNPLDGAEDGRLVT